MHLHKLRPRQLEEGGVGLRGARAREQRLARAGRPVQQHALGRPDAQRLEALLRSYRSPPPDSGTCSGAPPGAQPCASTACRWSHAPSRLSRSHACALRASHGERHVIQGMSSKAKPVEHLQGYMKAALSCHGRPSSWAEGAAARALCVTGSTMASTSSWICLSRPPMSE